MCTALSAAHFSICFMRSRRTEVATGSTDGDAVSDAAELVDADVDRGGSDAGAESRRGEGSEA